MQYTWLVATVTIKAGYTSTDVGAHTSSPILTEIFRTEGLKTKELQYEIQIPCQYQGIANNNNNNKNTCNV